MPALSVMLNGQPLVCVAANGFDVLDVGVSGDHLGPQYATLRVSAGSFPEGQQSQYLIWEDERNLVVGDVVNVMFLAEGTTSRRGKTIEELYSDEEPSPPEPFAPPEEVVRELKQKPKAFGSLSFEFVGPDGSSAEGHTSPDEHGFGFNVLWNSQRPERARAAVHTYTLDSLITRENGKYHGEAKLSFGQGVTFRVLAPNSNS